MGKYTALIYCVGLPVPIVTVSSAVLHKQYGDNDRYVVDHMGCSIISAYVDVG